MNTIRGQWDGYRADVVPPDAGEYQVLETRRSFYAGVVATICILEAVNELSVSDAAYDGIMQGISDELADYVAIVGTPAEREDL